MSIISSLAGGAIGLIGQIAGSLTQSASTATSQAQTVASTYARRQTRPEQLMADAMRAQGLDDETIAVIQNRINETITQLKAGGDVSRDTIKYAVDGILKEHGVDTEKFEAYMTAHQSRRVRQTADKASSSVTDQVNNVVDVNA